MSKSRAGRYRLVTGRLTARGVELHVLARAYSAAWLALHSEPPSGSHRFSDLGVTIDFGDSAVRENPSQRRRQRSAKA